MPSVQLHAGFDPASSESGYPVVESVPLTPLRRRLLRRTRRRAQELPELVGGAVWVFQSNERFEMAPGDGRMLSSDVVLNATMVAVVQTSVHQVPAVAELPTVHPGRRIALRASYRCQVLDAVRVLQEGRWDIRADLVTYLLQDAKTQMLAARVDVLDNPDVQQKILARTLARKALEPPRIPGMKVELIDIFLSVYAEEGSRLPLGNGDGPVWSDTGTDTDTDDGHDRYDLGRNGHRDHAQDDSYPPDGDEG